MENLLIDRHSPLDNCSYVNQMVVPFEGKGRSVGGSVLRIPYPAFKLHFVFDNRRLGEVCLTSVPHGYMENATKVP